MKRIILFLIIFFSTVVNADEEITTLATLNNISITNIDLRDEIMILKIISDLEEVEESVLQQSAFQNLVNQAIKEIELTINKIEIDEKSEEQTLAVIKKKLKDSGVKSARIYSKIKKKIQTDHAWKLLISKKYSWKLNINMNEINQKLKTLGYIDPNNLDTIKAKNNFRNQEKNKKFNFYSRNHLDLAKKKILIKIIK